MKLYLAVCIYQPSREVEWSACNAGSTKDQVRTKRLALVKSRRLEGPCPEEKVISKTCKKQKNDKKGRKDKKKGADFSRIAQWDNLGFFGHITLSIICDIMKCFG